MEFCMILDKIIFEHYRTRLLDKEQTKIQQFFILFNYGNYLIMVDGILNDIR